MPAIRFLDASVIRRYTRVHSIRPFVQIFKITSFGTNRVQRPSGETIHKGLMRVGEKKKNVLYNVQ